MKKNQPRIQTPVNNDSVPSSVLIMESDQTMGKMIKGYLESIGVSNIEVFSDALLALERIDQRFFDLIILDWKNKTPPGAEIFDHLRTDERTAYTPMILISGFVTKEDLTKTINHPSTNFLVKPFTEEVLLGVVHKLHMNANANFGDQLIEQRRLYAQAMPIEEPGDEGAFDISKLMGHTKSSMSRDSQKTKGFDIRKTTDQLNSGNWDLEAEPARQSKNLEMELSHNSKTPKAEQGTAGEAAGKNLQSDAKIDSMFDGDNSLDLDEEKKESTGGQSEFNYSKKTKNIKAAELDFDSEDTSDLGFERDYSKKQLSGSEIRYDKKKNSVQSSRSLQSVLIAESDLSLANVIDGYLREIHVEKIDVVRDGKTLWSKLDNYNYDLVIFDWNLKEVSGLKIYNRLRSLPRFQSTLVIVLCGFSNKEDFRILEEHPLTRFLEKPFQRELLEESISSIVNFWSVHEEVYDYVRDLIDPMIMSHIDVGEIIKKINTKFPKNYRVLNIAGEYLIQKKMYSHAERILLYGQKLAPYHIGILSNLGKVYHFLNQPKKSFQLLKRANFISPQNIERLCLLGEVGLSLQDPKRAGDYFNKVLAIDEDHAVAHAGKIVAENMQDHLKKHNDSKPLSLKFSSILNVIGITYVRNKEFEKGIEQYIAAMSFIRDKDILSKLQFNLGLAYLRYRKFDKAKTWFEAAQLNSSEDFVKPQMFLEKLDDFRRASPDDLQKLANSAFELNAA